MAFAHIVELSMRIPVIYNDNTEDCVPDMLLERLLSSNSIKLFYRFSEGWVKVGAGALRGKGGYYSGPDRRSFKEREKAGLKLDDHWRGGELSQYREQLDELVKERTADLQAELARRRQTEDALRQSELRFRNLVETTNDLIWETDKSLAFSYVSPQVEKLLGFGQDDCIGKTVFDLMPPEEAARTHNILRSVVTKKIPFYSQDHIVRHKNGHVLTFECSAVPIFDVKGRFGGYRGISREISGRKKSEGEYFTRKKLESVGVLAGGIAHDFNNLLQVILGNISLAKELATSDGQIISLLEQAENASRWASDVTKRLITFSSGGAPVKEIISIAGVIKDAAILTLSGSNVKCEFEIAGDLRPVEADEGQIRQVINNIVRNGQEAMGENGILYIRAENIKADTGLDPSLAAGRYIRISIKDNGIGIPEENLCKVCDPYFTTKEMGARKGEGLGLAVCHSIIKNHKGAIHVESREGAGSVFIIYLPASPRHRGLRGRAAEKLRRDDGRGVVMNDKKNVLNSKSALKGSLRSRKTSGNSPGR